jgi:hypothetical protein
MTAAFGAIASAIFLVRELRTLGDVEKLRPIQADALRSIPLGVVELLDELEVRLKRDAAPVAGDRRLVAVDEKALLVLLVA